MTAEHHRLLAGDKSGDVCFEPNGMAYPLEPGEVMYVRVDPAQLAEMQIEYWDGGVFMWFSGNVMTLDKDGKVLDEIWNG